MPMPKTKESWICFYILLFSMGVTLTIFGTHVFNNNISESTRAQYLGIGISLVVLTSLVPSLLIFLYTLVLLGYSAGRLKHLALVYVLPERLSVRGSRYQGALPCLDDCVQRVDALCDVCRSICNKSLLLCGAARLVIPSSEKHAHHAWEQLVQSAEKCHLCHLLLQSIRCEDPNTSLSLYMREERKPNKAIKLYIGISGSSIESVPLTVKHRAFRHVCDNSDGTLSPAIIGIVRDWITRCQHDHPVCRPQAVLVADARKFRPTRLLDLQADLTGARCMLVHGSSRLGSLEYVALSHCWGATDMPVSLVSHDRQRIRDGTMTFAVHELSRNFQDAIAVTRDLGYQYLWIDSLCIIQGDKEDWAAEVNKMGSVYAHAVFVLSAAVSAGHSEGFARDRTRIRSPICLLRGRRQKRNTEIVEGLVATMESSEEPGMTAQFEALVENSPLMSRAWPFQERVLAQRIVHFCAGTVLFECNTIQASESHIDGVTYPWKPHLRADGSPRTQSELNDLAQYTEELELRTIQWPHKLFAGTGNGIGLEFFRSAALSGMRGEFRLMLEANQPVSLPERLNLHCGWWQLVEQYSRRSITKKSDKLGAIMGIARFIEKCTEGREFQQGGWKDTIAFDLLWSVASSPLPLYRIPDSDVPTWSWVSIDGPVISRLRAEYQDSSTVNIVALIDAVLSAKETNKDIDSIDGVRLDSALLISCHGLLSRDETFQVTLDTPENGPGEGGSAQPRPEHHYLQVLLVRDVQPQPLARVHGIVLQKYESGQQRLVDYFKRVGYFWNDIKVQGDGDGSLVNWYPKRTNIVLV
ncbi:HET domain-containing protein [Microdochium nivale]|nr:HET domain-containing protein [Microdochium nivale]